MNNDEINIDFDFGEQFLWGAAISAHQAEGGNHNQWTVWELENAKQYAKMSGHELRYLGNWDSVKAEASDPNNYVSGRAADHFHLYKKDFDYLEKMHMNAFRFSIEWSRIEPCQGEWDLEAINYYRDYINELRSRNIEPILTLFHFTLPVWFADMGGFEYRANVKYFVRFAKKIVQEIGANVKYIITVNEPEAYVFQGYYNKNWPPAIRSFYKSWKVVGNLAHAHNCVERELHAINKGYKLSIAKNSIFFSRKGSFGKSLYAFILQYFQDDYFIKKVIHNCDFLGVNYYFSSKIYGHLVHEPNKKVNDLGWDMQPAEIQFVLERLFRKYKVPIIITENGLADAGDKNRKWWITQTLTAMQKAIENGVKLDGYVHWSLIDNFEWAFGKWPRFGLVEVDYETGERTMRQSAVWFGEIIKKVRRL